MATTFPGAAFEPPPSSVTADDRMQIGRCGQLNYTEWTEFWLGDYRRKKSGEMRGREIGR